MPPTIVNGLLTPNAHVDVLGAVSCVEVPPTIVIGHIILSQQMRLLKFWELALV